MYAMMLTPSIIFVLLISGGYYWTISTTPDCTTEIIILLHSSNDGNDACVPLMLSHPGMKFILTVAIIGMTGCVIFVPLLNYLVYRNLRNKASMSSSEKSVQKQVSITLITQVCIIAATSIAPLGCILINMVLTTSNPVLSTSATTMFSFLPVINPIMTIYVIRSYRQKVLLLIGKVLNRKAPIIVKGTTS
uniref:G_PROTEIN_RECEP_F1_2 domain-containing protein n=1 Tax=Panagrellus redivivus TaxID=6233 RepID=A0A7E4VD31_PANRE